MHAVDTNVLVRFFITDDNIEQTKRVVDLFRREPIFISASVLMETEWVLRGIYKRNRLTINNGFEKLFNIDGVTIETAENVTAALRWHQAGMDFADAIHLASTLHCDKFATFDLGIKKSAPADQKARILQL